MEPEENKKLEESIRKKENIKPEENADQGENINSQEKPDLSMPPKGENVKKEIFEQDENEPLESIKSHGDDKKDENKKKKSLKEKASELKKQIPALYIALKNSKTPGIARILAIITVAYALSPIDLVPDFIPVLGYLDDVILLPALVALTVRLIPQEIWKESILEAEGMWENGKPKKWYYAMPVIVIWALIIWLIIKAVIK